MLFFVYGYILRGNVRYGGKRPLLSPSSDPGNDGESYPGNRVLIFPLVGGI